jgi:AP-2 complex subunit alpha
MVLCCLQWYVDVVLALLERAGDFCSSDVWHRVVQLVTNNEGSQSYAAEQVMEVLQRGASHEALVCLAAYVLGEYGRLIRVSKWQKAVMLGQGLMLVTVA